MNLTVLIGSVCFFTVDVDCYFFTCNRLVFAVFQSYCQFPVNIIGCFNVLSQYFCFHFVYCYCCLLADSLVVWIRHGCHSQLVFTGIQIIRNYNNITFNREIFTIDFSSNTSCTLICDIDLNRFTVDSFSIINIKCWVDRIYTECEIFCNFIVIGIRHGCHS